MTHVDPEAFVGPANPNLGPGVWPDRRDLLPRHFQLVGDNPRALVVSDMGGLISVGGVEVTNPQHLEEFALRLSALAAVYRERSPGRDA